MAKKSEIKSSRIYGIVGIIYAVLLLAGIAGVATVFTIRQNTAEDTETSMSAVYTIKVELLAINEKSIMTIGNMGSPEMFIKDIANSFDIIDENMKLYEECDSHSENELARYNQAKVYINALHSKLKSYEDKTEPFNTEQIRNVYIQEFAPYQTSAIEMLDAAIDMDKENSEEQINNAKILFRFVWGSMAACLILGEIAIRIAARINRKQTEEAAIKARQAAAAEKKFKHSQEKMNDIAYTNILTGMKNRYALENDLSDRLESDQFNIAVFDMDNFRSINDTYGYDFGDEYLAQIAEKLKNEFGDVAEIYNITGNEFCFVFNRDVSDIQALRLAENILASMSSMYTVANLAIQLSASGSTYHYLPGDCMNLSALLVKMDNVIRNAKRQGGNTILKVIGV